MLFVYLAELDISWLLTMLINFMFDSTNKCNNIRTFACEVVQLEGIEQANRKI